jgi:hypothetical protein
MSSWREFAICKPESVLTEQFACWTIVKRKERKQEAATNWPISYYKVYQNR